MPHDNIIFKNEIKEKIEWARINRRGYVFKNLFPNTPSWEQIINHLNYEYNNKDANSYYEEYKEKGHFDKSEYQQYGEIIKNGVVFYENKDLYVSCSTYTPVKFYPQVLEPQNLFREILGDQSAKFGQVFINFVSNDNKINMHVDQRETIFWLMQGKVTWILADPENWDNTTRYDLEAGDIMFAPWGLPHTVESHSPRAGMIMSAYFEKFDYLKK